MTKKALTTTKTSEGEKAEIVTIDKKIVDEAVKWIRDTALEGIKKTLVEVGDYILKRFFNDDIELARSKNPLKNASFRALAERCGTAGFPVSKTWLNSAVGVAMMIRLLSSTSSAFRQLGPALQETLLPLKDPERVEKVAQKVIEGEFTLREARKAVAQERAKTPKGDGRGRRPAPSIVKTLNRSLKLFAFEGGKRSFTKADVEELDEEQKKVAIKSAEALVEKVKALVEKLKSA